MQINDLSAMPNSNRERDGAHRRRSLEVSRSLGRIVVYTEKPETGFEETSGDALERAVPHPLRIAVNVHPVSAERLPGPC